MRNLIPTILLAVGAGLMYLSVRNLNPLSAVKSIARTGTLDEAVPIYVARNTPGSDPDGNTIFNIPDVIPDPDKFVKDLDNILKTKKLNPATGSGLSIRELLR